MSSKLIPNQQELSDTIFTKFKFERGYQHLMECGFLFFNHRLKCLDVFFALDIGHRTLTDLK